MSDRQLIGQINRPIADILADFAKPIPPEKLSQKDSYRRDKATGKPIPSGKITFIHWYDLIETLLWVAPGYGWQVRTRTDSGREIVEGKLTIRAAEGDYIFEAVGVEDSDSNSFGDPLYSAEASALRRAMAKAGYGLELWRKDKRAISSAPEKAIVNSQQLKSVNQPIKTPQDLNQKTITQKQVSLLYAIAKKESGLAEEDLKLIIKAWGYESTKNIAIANFDSILTAVKNAAKYLTIAQRKELQQWWRTEKICDSVAKRAISGMGFDSTANILRSQINGIKSRILKDSKL